MMIVENFEQIVQNFAPQAKLLRAWKLTGGVSAQVTALEISLPDGQTQKYIVRQHGAIDLAQNPDIATDEFKLLSALHSAGLPVPQPYFVDTSAKIFDAPYIVLEFIDGETDFAPANLDDFLRQMASVLAQIHRLDLAQHDLSFLPTRDAGISGWLKNPPATLDETLQESRIRHTLGSAWRFPNMNPAGLLHGDYWVGNLLWKNGELTGVVDWEDATLGDPLSDLAVSRLEVLWAFGADAMHTYTRHYQAAMPALDYANLPLWDIYAASRPLGKIDTWGLDDNTIATMRERHYWFVNAAFKLLENR